MGVKPNKIRLHRRKNGIALHDLQRTNKRASLQVGYTSNIEKSKSGEGDSDSLTVELHQLSNKILFY